MPILHSRQSVEDQEANIGQNETRNLGGFCIVLIIIAATCMVLRVLSRNITKQGLARDDWTFLGGSVGPCDEENRVFINYKADYCSWTIYRLASLWLVEETLFGGESSNSKQLLTLALGSIGLR